MIAVGVAGSARASESRHAPTPATIKGRSPKIFQAVRSLGFKKVALVGHDWGGPTCVRPRVDEPRQSSSVLGKLRTGRVAVGLLASGFLCACSSAYEPVRSPRIAMVVDGGSPSLVKDGTHYGNPAFGVGVLHAVQGNPRAEEQARIGRNLAFGGLVFDLAGLGSEAGGLLVLQHDRDRGEPSSLATGLILSGLGAVIVGGVMLITAQPHIYDAINIYNDGVSATPH
jgi:hypothetical protein